jgi:hypothetical protein
MARKLGTYRPDFSKREHRSDKGTTGKRKYTQVVRRTRAMARSLRQTLDDIAKFEKWEEHQEFMKQRRRKQDAKRKRFYYLRDKSRIDITEKVLNNKERRHEKRQETLQRLVPNRICKCCELQKLNSKQWVHIQATLIEEMICKQCYTLIKELLKTIEPNVQELINYFNSKSIKLSTIFQLVYDKGIDDFYILTDEYNASKTRPQEQSK